MKKYLLIIGYVLSVLSLSAQELSVDTTFSYFNKIYFSDSTQVLSHCVLPLDSSSYLIAGPTTAFTGEENFSGLYIRKVNLIGETVWVKLLDTENGWSKDFNTGSQMVKDEEGNIALSYTRGDLSLSTNFKDIRAYKFTPEGEIIWTYDYPSPYSEGVRSMAATPDGGFILGGQIEYSVLPDSLLLIKLDEEGQMDWSNTYSMNEAESHQIFDIIPTSDGGYIGAGGAFVPGVANSADMLALKVDSLGNQEWLKRYGEDEGDFIPTIHEINEQEYLLSGAIRDNGIPKTYFAFLDQDGDTLLTKKYILANNASSLIQMIPAIEDNYIGITHYTNEYGNGVPKLIYLNSEMDTIWTKPITYDPEGAAINPRDIEATYDGGYILCGWRLYESPQFSWVAKVDSLGNCCSYTGDCDSLVIDTTEVYNTNLALAEKAVYAKWAPNPIQSSSSQLYYLSPARGPYTWLKIYNQMGMEVKSRRLSSYQQEALIDTRYLNNGIHVYTLETDGVVWHKGKLIVAK